MKHVGENERLSEEPIVRSYKKLPLSLSPLFYLLFLSAVVIAAVGYVYYESDQFSYFLKPFSILDPSFCRGDWFTQAYRDYHIAFTLLITAVGSLLPMWLGVFSVWLLLILIFVMMARSLVNDEQKPWLTTGFLLAIFLWGANKGWGHVVPTLNVLLPNTIGFVFSLAGFAAWYRKRFLVAGILLGIAGLFHINYTVCIFLALGFHFLLFHSIQPRGAWLKLGLPFIVLSAPNVIWILTLYSGPESSISLSDEALSVMTTQRSWWHFLPHQWPLTWTLRSVNILALGFISFFLGHRVWERKLLAQILVTLLLTWTIAYVCTEIIGPVASVVNIFLWRTVPVGFFLSAVLIVSRVFDLCKQADKNAWLELLLVATAVFLNRSYPYLAMALLLAIVLRLVTRRRCGIIAELLFLHILIGLAIWLKPFRNIEAVRQCVWTSIYAVGAIAAIWFLVHRRFFRPMVSKGLELLVMVLLFAAHPVYFSSGGQFRLMPEFQPYHHWIQKQTAPGTVFLVAPTQSDFRMKSRRAVFVDAKSFPRTSSAILEWRKRMLQVHDFSNLTPERVVQMQSQYQLDYLVLQNGHPNRARFSAGFAEVYRDGEVAVFRLPHGIQKSR